MASQSPTEDRLNIDLAGALAAAGLVVGAGADSRRGAAHAARRRRWRPPCPTFGEPAGPRRRGGPERPQTAARGRADPDRPGVRHRGAQAGRGQADQLGNHRHDHWHPRRRVGLILVLIKVGQSFDTIKGAAWGWVAVTAVLAQLAYPSTALSEIGTVDGAPLRAGGRSRVRQRIHFTGRRTPATFGTRVRFFQQQGFDATQAVTSGSPREHDELDRQGRPLSHLPPSGVGQPELLQRRTGRLGEPRQGHLAASGHHRRW